SDARGDRDGHKEDDSASLLTEHGSTPTKLGSDPGVIPVQYAISVEKAANAVDPLNPTAIEEADAAPGQFFATGTAITWTYLVTNIGTGSVANVSVRDDNGTADTADDFFAVAVM